MVIDYGVFKKQKDRVMKMISDLEMGVVIFTGDMTITKESDEIAGCANAIIYKPIQISKFLTTIKIAENI